MIQLNPSDKEQIKEKGISEKDIEWQLNNFKNGFPPIDLVAPATAGDGILQPGEDEILQYQKYFTRKTSDFSLLKFIPSSGAASRMFKFLFEYLQDTSKNQELVEKFIQNISHFAFYKNLKNVFSEKGLNLQKEINKKNYSVIIEHLLYPVGLNYGSLPKALIEFHKYPDHTRTPIEEHIMEGSEYAENAGNHVRLHFTISPEHEDLFEEKVLKVKNTYAEAFELDIEIEHSFQKEHTDMIAVDKNNNLFRNEDGSLLFRPGGHGALLENLNNLDADLIFIKNIDNVVPDKLKEDTFVYKKVIAGILIDLQEKTFDYLELLDQNNATPELLEEIIEFAETFLCVRLPREVKQKGRNQLKDYLHRILNRPIRVCGMVKNEGEPGGGPFWVRDKEGKITLQIVEMAQINTNDPKQEEIVGRATHFNPVDLVCGVKDYKGRKFNLTDFRDSDTGIITEKSKDGKSLKAQELPGLWNGAMAYWNTIFVEVPLITFTPVKTVNDLLRKEHQ